MPVCFTLTCRFLSCMSVYRNCCQVHHRITWGSLTVALPTCVFWGWWIHVSWISLFPVLGPVWRPRTVKWWQFSLSNCHSTTSTQQTEYREALPLSANVQSHLTLSFATMVMLHNTRFVECRWWTVKTVITWCSSASMILAPGFKNHSVTGPFCARRLVSVPLAHVKEKLRCMPFFFFPFFF